MGLNTLKIPSIILDPLNRPRDCITEGLAKYRHASLPDSRQAFSCPLTRRALSQLSAIKGIAAFLQPIEPFLVEGFLVPFYLGDPTIQTGLVGGHGEFSVDSRDAFLVSNDQTGEILSEMLAFRLVDEKVCELIQGFLDDAWKLHDSGHGRILPDSVRHPATVSYRQITHLHCSISILQKFS